MLNVHELSLSFGGTYLFRNISFRIGAGDRVGLIGKNGAGKSTLLKVIAKDISEDSGQIATEKDIKIGFLRQDIDFEKGRTVREEAYTAFEELLALEKEIEEINNQLATRTDYESQSYHDLMVSVSETSERFEMLGGYQYPGETEKILLGLGFQPADFDQPTDTFSGGWRMRIELAKLLLQHNDLLLLDEPTNHLDIESIIWLENFLKNYKGALMMVSHDKMFLNQVTNRTIEITAQRIYDFNKSYTQYLLLRKEIITQQLSAQKNQEKEIAQTERLIERFRAKASKASMAQSLIKKLDKIDRIEVDSEETETMKITFPVSIQPGKVVVETKNLSKSYGDKKVLHEVNIQIVRGQKISFVGQNGQGKSTLAKIMVNEIDYQGECQLGHNVQIGYFAQNQAEYLEGEKTVLDTMIDAANETNRRRVRDILGSFLFRGDDVDKKVKVLSGGERNRLALSKLLLQPFNVLVMDEPTNHLDIQSKNVLKAALQNFDGTLILVSHDRDFLDGLSEKVYEFRNHKLKEYLGDINYYLEQRSLDSLREAEKKDPKEKIHKSSNGLKNELQKKMRSIQNKISNTESKINAIEKQLAQWDVALAENYDETVSDATFFDNYQSKKEELKDSMQRWEKLQDELDQQS
ncbi:MAG: ATP-binding cassette domain-containing protein [Flavobacteriaceae bacterium]|nr:ATP-binding cassette domain-containing protein [Flavobacteriaceae bacterium]MDG2314151.1 ATP-binding cassette domain-containing protein [Flavobacteriaceae bacterium]